MMDDDRIDRHRKILINRRPTVEILLMMEIDLLKLKCRVIVTVYQGEVHWRCHRSNISAVGQVINKYVSSDLSVTEEWFPLAWWRCWRRKVQVIDQTHIILPPFHYNCRCVREEFPNNVII